MITDPHGSVRVLITGPQGSGKGTQGILIAEAFHVPAIATGDVFRANMAQGTELGRLVESTIKAGHLVSDELTSDLVRDRLLQADAASGFVLDGYPRSPRQLADLDSFLSERDETLDVVVALDVPREESVRRVLQRAVEQGRADDTAEGIAQRLALYERETAPIIDTYRGRGLVVEVDGVGTMAEVTERIFAGLSQLGLNPTL